MRCGKALAALVLVCLATSGGALAPCNVTLPQGYNVVADLQSVVDGTMNSTATLVVCFEPTTYTGCNEGLSLRRDVDAITVLRGVQLSDSVRTTIDCSYTGRLVRAATSHPFTLHIVNMTVANGTSSESDNDVEGSAIGLPPGATLSLTSVSILGCADHTAVVVGAGGVVTATYSVFNGNTATVSDVGGVFYAHANSTVVIASSEFADNSASGGSALGCYRATVFVYSCSAVSVGGGTYQVNDGGVFVLANSSVQGFYDSGVFASSATAVSLEGSTFSATARPFAVYYTESLLVRNSTWTGSVEEPRSFYTDVVLEDSVAYDNTANGNVGCYVLGGLLAVTRCSFTNNVNQNVGTSFSGVLCATNAESAVVIDSVFYDNRGMDQGGGFSFTSEFGTAVVSGCVFSNNYAYKGGGVAAWMWSPLLLVGCRFVENECDEAGGGLVSALGSVIGLDCVFEANDGLNGDGSAAYSFANAIFNNSVFDKELADSYVVRASLMIANNSTFTRCSTDVGLWPVATVAADCAVEACTAWRVAFPAGDSSVFSRCLFKNIHSGSLGLILTSGDVVMSECILSGSTSEGELIRMVGTTMLFLSSSVEECTGYPLIGTSSGSVFVVQSTFWNNTGHFHVRDGSSMNVSSTDVHGHAASSVVEVASDSTFSSFFSSFEGNTCGTGGVASVVGGGATAAFSQCSLTNNVANYGACFFSSFGGSLVVNSCVVENNTATDFAEVYLGLLAGSVSFTNTSVSPVLDSSIFAFLVSEVALVDMSLAASGEGTAVYILGAASVSVTSSSLTSELGANIVPLVTRGCENVAFVDSLVGSDGSSPGLQCGSSSLSVSGTVFCADSAPPMECTGCTVSGDLSACVTTSVDSCYDECKSEAFCVAPTTWTNPPNLGCPLCGGPCELDTTACDGNSTYCLDTESGGFECLCLSGFVPDTPLECSDVDECSDGTHDCIAPAYCVNTAGSFTCDCPPGYSHSSATSCTDINECATECVSGYATGCVNTAGSYYCTCAPGAYVYGASSECRLCGPGYYEAGGGATCLACGAGAVSNVTGASACQPCSDILDNSEPNSARTGCVCIAGLSLVDGVCIADCVLGQRRLGDIVCVGCGSGFYGLVPGTCAACPPLATTLVTNATSADQCVCAPGTLLVGGGGGSGGSDGSNATADIECALACGPGLYVEVNAAACVSCPIGSYSNSTTTATACSDCPYSGMVTVATGAADVSECVCPSGLALESLGGGTTQCTTYCPPGKSRPDLVGTCEECGPGTYSDTANAESCSECPENTVSTPGASRLNQCVCKVGFYNAARETGRRCRRCPGGAECSGGTAPPTSRPGYYPDGNGGFVQCSPAEACSGDSGCSDGYTGDRCASCQLGYYRVSGFCRPRGFRSALGAVFGIVGAVGLCVGLVTFNLRDAASGRIHSIAIGLNALQIVAQFGRLSIAWPDYVQAVFDILAAFNFSIEIVAPDCAAGVASVFPHPFALRFTLAMLLPALFAFILATGYAMFVVGLKVGLWGGSGESGSGGGSGMEFEMRRAILQSGLQLAMILYLPLSVAVFDVFDCVAVGDVRVLASSPDVVCGSSLWRSILPAAIVCLLVYPLATPLCLGALFYFGHLRYGEEEFTLKFGYLTNRYTLDYPYYELVIMFRKLGVAIALTFITDSAYIQGGSALMWLLFNFVVHQYLRPYSFKRNNELESMLLLSVGAVIQLGIMFQDEVLSDTAKGVIILGLLFLVLVEVAAAIGYEVRVRKLEEREAGRETASEYVERSKSAHVRDDAVDPMDTLATVPLAVLPSSAVHTGSTKLGDDLRVVSGDSMRETDYGGGVGGAGRMYEAYGAGISNADLATTSLPFGASVGDLTTVALPSPSPNSADSEQGRGSYIHTERVVEVVGTGVMREAGSDMVGATVNAAFVEDK